MSSHDHRDQVEQLRTSAAHLPWGYARAELLQEAAQIADGHQDLDLAFEIRRDLIDAARYSLRYDLFAASFAWCFATAQQHPDRFPIGQVLRYYQYVIGNLANFAHVSRAQYDDLHADACRHFTAHGYSLRTLMIERRSAAIDYADPVMAEAAGRDVPRHRRDDLHMAPEMEVLRQVEYELYREDDAAAARALDAHFANDRRSRWADPWAGNLAVRVYARLGRTAEAERLHERHHRQFEAGGGYGWSWGNHISYCAATGRLARGVELFRRQLPVAMSHADTLTQFYCLSHAVPLLDALAAAGATTVHLPHVPGLPAGDDLDGVRGWLDATVAAITADFDRRNGNGYYSDLAGRRRAGLI